MNIDFNCNKADKHKAQEILKVWWKYYRQLVSNHIIIKYEGYLMPRMQMYVAVSLSLVGKTIKEPIRTNSRLAIQHGGCRHIDTNNEKPFSKEK